VAFSADAGLRGVQCCSGVIVHYRGVGEAPVLVQWTMTCCRGMPGLAAEPLFTAESPRSFIARVALI
jgi:hypothetical protein